MEMRFTYNSDQVTMYRVKTLRGFERIVSSLLEHRENPYRLFILYKDTHRVKKVEGRVFMWDETEETRNGIDVESGEQGFGEPRFDGVWAALFITDECVVAFGDARLVAEIFDELSHADRAWKACGCGESVHETIEEAIRTYKCEVEKMNEKVEKLERRNDDYM